MKTIIPVIALCIFAAITAEAQQTLTLEQCRAMAIENNKTAAIAAKTEEKTAYDSKALRANFFPNISASGAWLYANTGMNRTIEGNYLPTFVADPATGQLQPNLLTLPDGTPVTGADGNPVFKQYAYFPDMDLNLRLNGTWFAGIQAEQPLFTGGKILSAYKMSQTGREIARLNTNLTRAEIIVRTDEAFFHHLKAIESKKVAIAFKKVVDELLRNVEAATQTGMKTKNDLLKVQVQANNADLLLLRANNAIRLSAMNLCQTIGLPLRSPIIIADSITETGADHAIQPSATADYTLRSEYAILEKQIELKDQQIRLVRSDFLPNLGLMANYGYMHGIQLNGAPLFDRASFSAFLSLKIPIFHWGEGMNKIRAARAEESIMQLQRDDLNEKMALEAQQALDRCEESAAELRLTLRALQQAAENMRTSRDHYDVGMETLANCLEAQTLWQQAWLDMISAQINRRLHETYYLKATGRL